MEDLITRVTFTFRYPQLIVFVRDFRISMKPFYVFILMVILNFTSED